MAEEEEMLANTLSKLPTSLGELLYRAYYSAAAKAEKHKHDEHANHWENHSESGGSDLYKTGMEDSDGEEENQRGAKETMGESSSNNSNKGSGGGHQGNHTKKLPNLKQIGYKNEATDKGVGITEGTTDQFEHLRQTLQRVNVGREGKEEGHLEGKKGGEGATQTNLPTSEIQPSSPTYANKLSGMLYGIAGSIKNRMPGSSSASASSQPQTPNSSPRGKEHITHTVQEGDLSRGLPTADSSGSPLPAGQAAPSSPTSGIYGFASGLFSKVLGRGADDGASSASSQSSTPNASPVQSPRNINPLAQNVEPIGEEDEDLNVKKNKSVLKQEEANGSNGSGLPISSALQDQSPPLTPKSAKSRLGAFSDFFTSTLGLSAGDGGGGSPSSFHPSTPTGSPTYSDKDLSAGGLEEPTVDDNVNVGGKKKSVLEQEKVPSSKPSTPTKKTPRLSKTSSLDKAVDFRVVGGNDEADKREELTRENNEGEIMRDSLGNTAAIVSEHKVAPIAEGIVEGGEVSAGEASAKKR